jgi:hypothetical protein
MRQFLLAIIFATVVSSVAAQTPAQHMRADIMRFRDAEVRVTPGVVRRNEAIISVPFSYIRTGVLRSDVRGSMFRQIHGTAGSPAYWAGQFNGPVSGPYDVWCVFPLSDGRGPPSPYCAARPRQYATATVLNPNNPRFFFVIRFSYGATLVSPFDIEERDVEVEPDLRLEYRFREWDRDDLDLTIYSARSLAHVFSVPRNPDGSADLDTLAGRVHLTPGPEGRGVIAEFPAQVDAVPDPK